jgi:hypothetical protein
MLAALMGCGAPIQAPGPTCASHDNAAQCADDPTCATVSGETWDADARAFGPTGFIACVDAESCADDTSEPVILDRDGECLRTMRSCEPLDELVVTSRDDACQIARAQAVDCESYTFDECDRSDFCNTVHAGRRRGDCLGYEPIACLSRDINCNGNQIAARDSDGTCWFIEPGCTPSDWPTEQEDIVPECEGPLSAPFCE